MHIWGGGGEHKMLKDECESFYNLNEDESSHLISRCQNLLRLLQFIMIPNIIYGQ